jgi:transglutaminase-like putative cysteine protease
MILRSLHTTTYSYTDPVVLCHNLLHLAARATPLQACRSSEVQVCPTPAVYAPRTDSFGNPELFLTIQEPHRKLEVTAVNVVELTVQPLPDTAATPAWEQVRDFLPGTTEPDVLEASAFLFDSPYVVLSNDLAAYASASFWPGRPILEGILDLTARIHAEFRYDPEATSIATPLREVLSQRRGVCQDFAHLAIGCLRALGLAARYVSGYLMTTPPPGRPRLVGADASHAWLSVFIPGLGWIDTDPTNNLCPCDKHVTLAWGRDYDDVSPIKGVILGGGDHTVRVAVDLVPAG